MYIRGEHHSHEGGLHFTGKIGPPGPHLTGGMGPGGLIFRLVRSLRARKCEQGRGLGACSPRKIRHSEIASEAMFGAKKATRISPSVTSVAREAIEPNCQK